MSGAAPVRAPLGLGAAGAGAVALVVQAGGAAGAKAAAAALACAGSQPDRAGLLIELDGGRSPRPTPIASAAARELEERLVAHVPEAGVASRGQTCHLTLPGGAEGIERLAAALPLARDSVAVLHVPPRLFRAALEEPRIAASGLLLRADLGADRALVALAVREPIERGLRVAILKRPLGWLAARRALLGLLPGGAAGGLPPRVRQRLLTDRAARGVAEGSSAAMSQRCYGRQNDAEAEPAGAAQQERRGDAGARPGRGLHRDPQRGAGR